MKQAQKDPEECAWVCRSVGPRLRAPVNSRVVAAVRSDPMLLRDPLMREQRAM